MADTQARYNPLLVAKRMFQAIFGSDRGAVFTPDINARRSLYDFLWNYYANQQYDRLQYGGTLDYINETLGEAAARDLAGLFNPVERVVELYASNVFGQNFGDGVDIDPVVGTKRNQRPVNERILDPLELIWQWSNINIEKTRYVRYGSIFGTVGIRIRTKVGDDYPNDDPKERRVYLQFEHPGAIVDLQTDDRCNLDQILTEHRRTEGELSIIGSNLLRRTYTYRELITKEKIQTTRDGVPYDEINERENGPFADYPNEFGYVPYVLAWHRKHDSDWGQWCFSGHESQIDRLNALVAHINRQIHRHVNATWAVTSSGEPPKEFNLNGNHLIWFETDPETGGGGATIEALVAKLSVAEAIEEARFMQEELRDALPEMKALDNAILSGTSGQTITEARLPAEERVMSARTLYEDALVRASKIALSYGIALGLWNVGTGTGSWDAAKDAYKKGLLDHKYADRPALKQGVVAAVDAEGLPMRDQPPGTPNSVTSKSPLRALPPAQQVKPEQRAQTIAQAAAK